MTRSFLNCGAALALLAAMAGLMAPVQEAEGEHGAAPPAGPHARAPYGVTLEITQPDKQLAWVKDIERLAAADSGRFRKEGETWVDSRGEFTWDEEEEVYWRNVPADVLTRGRQDFVQFCASCHGVNGDGYGRSAQGLRPPPRSFLQSTFKFTKVPSDFLPNDEALMALIRHGLDGTPMLPWDVSDERLHEILLYVKSLSPEDSGWHDSTNEIGDVVYTTQDPVEDPNDPWFGKPQDAIAEGEKAYHVNQCYSCHPAYVPATKIDELRGAATPQAYREDVTYSKLVEDTAFTVLDYRVAIIPTDFTWHTVRYGKTTREVFQTIAAGIGGAGMPTWGRPSADSAKGGLDERVIWSIAHYVRHLIDTYKDKPAERAAFMASVRSGQ